MEEQNPNHKKLPKTRNTLLLGKYETRDLANKMYLSMKRKVEADGKVFDFNDELKNNLYQFADLIASATPIYGILIIGGCGVGKSLMTKAFHDVSNYYCQIGQIPYKYDWELVRWINVREYMDLFLSNEQEYRRYKDTRILVLDDLGVEYNEVVKFGTKMRPIEDLIDYRYRQRYLTIITTNIATDEFGTKYSSRIVNRFREMFPNECIIAFNHVSYRNG